jgi:hypothetical protein
MTPTSWPIVAAHAPAIISEPAGREEEENKYRPLLFSDMF